MCKPREGPLPAVRGEISDPELNYFILHHLCENTSPSHAGLAGTFPKIGTAPHSGQATTPLVRSRRPLSSLWAASQVLVPWGPPIDLLPVKLRVGEEPTASPPTAGHPTWRGMNYLIGGGTLVSYLGACAHPAQQATECNQGHTDSRRWPRLAHAVPTHTGHSISG